MHVLPSLLNSVVNYGSSSWPSVGGSDSFVCVPQPEVDPLACPSTNSKVTFLACHFQCGSRGVKAREVVSVAEVFDDVSPVAPVTGNTLSSAYVHGFCSFSMQLFQQCKSKSIFRTPQRPFMPPGPC
jgi:hypothetical protein